MRQCGFVILVLLGLFTNYVSNVDAAPLPETCSALKSGLVQCASVTANMFYCSTGKPTPSCLDYANQAISIGCTDPEIVTAASAMKQKCQAFMCDLFKIHLETCKETDPVPVGYCVTGTSSCLDKAIAPPPLGCTGAEIDTAVAAIKNKCPEFMACSAFKYDLKECEDADPLPAGYCKTGTSSCLDKAILGPPTGCTGTEIDTAVDAIKNKCPTYLCDTFKNDLQACEGTDPLPAGYCATGASSCLGKAKKATSKGCTDPAITTAAAAIIQKCADFQACIDLKAGVVRCSTATVDAAYCDTGKDTPSCLIKANEAASKDCTDPDIKTAVAVIEDRCKVFVACDTFQKELDNCVSSTVNAAYCSTGASSCLDKANEAYSMDCKDPVITEAANRIRNSCQELDKKCDDYWQAIQTNCAPDKADADYCDENVEGSCYYKLKFLNDTCPDKDPGDEGHKIQKKCDEPDTTLEHCRNYLTAMFDCWNDGKLFPTSCSSHTERYKVLHCVNEAREQHEDKCNSDVTKQYNSNMVIFLNATDKFLCQGNTPQFDVDCLDSTVSKDIIVSSFAGDMNECGPLLETIEMFKAKLGKDKCKILVDEYLVEIKKLDYCHPKRVTSEPCEKDGHGNIQLNILIGNGNHDNNIGGMA